MGEYDHRAYGILKIGLKDNQLQFDFHKIRLPLIQLKFRIPEFADVVIEFVEENGQITALKQITPSGEYVAKRK